MNTKIELVEVYNNKFIPVKDLQLSTDELCKKHDISKTTAWRWRDAANIKKYGDIKLIELLSETDKAYLAGLIDADGYITIKKVRKTAYPEIGIAQTKFDALEWMATKLNATVSFHTKSKTSKYGYHKMQMIVRVHGVKAQLLCNALLPYLKIKRRQAEIIRQFPCDAHKTGITNEINKVRFSMLEEIQFLNRRGNE